ncbi:3-ketoacyl-reductase [Truncatella angustata]|uniref:3-ketoacyl-reductase n=1 Tax=Truncatella angustata TaxID=152316 RepID=A0A9P8RQA2_9PEZI|nr:3-ketoacyl-reductase [Truncatella angustata]KAH6647398.1 3-ketoacyl-reductase [Truncatella angustata]
MRQDILNLEVSCPLAIEPIMSKLSDQVVLVTGSSRGLGLATARAFQAEGARVVLNCRGKDSLPKTEAIAKELGGIAIAADVTDKEQVAALFDQAASHFGQPISVVVNNALADYQFNGDGRKKLDSIEWEDFDKQIRVAVQGALNTTKAAISGFEKLGRGRIINIGSNLVQNPVVPYQDYCAAKGALLAFTRSMAAELGPKNITVNLVAGGLLKGTDASSATPKAVFDQIAAVTPLRKVTSTHDLAGAVLFFASPWASAITGQQVIVDGGLVMS